MKNLYIYTLAAIVLISTQACHRNIYIPNAQNVPLFQEKGEIQVNLGAGNIQAACSVTENIGIIINRQYSRNSSSGSSTLFGEDAPSKRNLTELGLGYYMKPNEKGRVFEVYAGVGIGEIEFTPRQNNTEDYFYAKNTRLFIQPAIGFSKQLIDLAFSFRFSHLNYYDLNTDNYQYDPDASMLENDLSQLDNSRYTFVEPALTFRIGWEYIKLHTQLVRTFKIAGNPINHRGNINVGIFINIAKRYKSKSIDANL